MTDTNEIKGVRIVRIISETKRAKGERPRKGFRRVQAVVKIKGQLFTRHGDTKDGEFLLMKMYSAPKKVVSSYGSPTRCIFFGCREEGTLQTVLGWFCGPVHQAEAAANIAHVFVTGKPRPTAAATQ